jgi:2-polyprenyl-3-methyl-5-hydroxy-6-metoxy-1,4-benzoquinol methylase
MDTLAAFKALQRERWANFAAVATVTTAPAARLVRYAGVGAGARVLDVACGTGVVSVTAARGGARVTGLDLTPELVAAARDNARIAGVDIEFHEGDVEDLPFERETFDIVISQYGHIFAPRPDVAIAEMLRVLKSGGTIAFSTWPPELYIGRLLALVARYAPPPALNVPSPALWGDPAIVRERLGARVRDIVFDTDTMVVPALSPQHSRELTERTSGQVMKAVERLGAADPAVVAAFRQELESLAAEYFSDNTVRQGYLLTRATKI